MNWDAISAVSDVVGVIALVVTLVYLARETRMRYANKKRAPLAGPFGMKIRVLTE